MTTENNAKLRLHTRLSFVTIIVGVALMTMMIVEESEPGAIPPLLILLGAGWYLTTRVRARSHRK